MPKNQQKKAVFKKTREGKEKVSHHLTRHVPTIAGVAILMLLVGGVGGYIFATNHTALQDSAPQKKEETLKAEQKTKLEQDSVFYYYEQEYNPDKFEVFEFLPDVGLEDKSIFSVDSRIRIRGSYKQEGTYLATQRSPYIHVLDLTKGEVNDLFKAKGVEGDSNITAAKLSRDGNKIAYTVFVRPKNEKEEARSRSILWVYNLKKQSHSKIKTFSREEIYKTGRVLGWTPKDKEIVIREQGGDGGFNWATLSVVNAESGEITRSYETLLSPDIEEKPPVALGKLSPDGDRLLYTYCENAKLADEGNRLSKQTCPGGEKIFVLNLQTGERETIYHNTTHPRNISNEKLRIIFSAEWAGKNEIIFSIPDGVFSLNTEDKSVNQIHEISFNDPDSIFERPHIVHHTGEDYVAITILNPEELLVINIKTGKSAKMQNTGVTFLP